MIKKIQFFIALVFISAISFSQNVKTDTDIKWKPRVSRCVVGIGIIYQNEYLCQGGIKFEIVKNRQNFSIIPSLQIQMRHVTYVSPSIVLRYYKPMIKNVGPTIALECSSRKINNITYSTLTPEIGINLNGALSIGYGYNIALTRLPGWSWRHRIVFRIMNL